MTKTFDRRYARRRGRYPATSTKCTLMTNHRNRKVLRSKYQVQGAFDGGVLDSIAEDIENVHPDKARMSLNACKTTSANDDMYEIKRAA